MPHPLEQLRYVARSWDAGEALPAREVAEVLAELALTAPNMLLQACRRLIEYFPGSGLAWWLCARALASPEPADALWDAVDELGHDPTPKLLAEALPEGTVVAFSPMADVVSAALRRRPGVRAAKKLSQAELLVVTAFAAGPDTLLTTSRAALAASTAVAGGKPVWAVVPRGALLPGELWEHLVTMALPAPDADLVPSENVVAVVGENGRQFPARALSRPTCPAVAELRGWRI